MDQNRVHDFSQKWQNGQTLENEKKFENRSFDRLIRGPIFSKNLVLGENFSKFMIVFEIFLQKWKIQNTHLMYTGKN